MDNLITAFESEQSRERVGAMLERGGLVVRAACSSGAEAIRRVNERGEGLIVCGFRLPDMTAPQLAADLSGLAMVLVLASAQRLEDCAGENIFKLAAPATRADLVASVNMLVQMEEKYLRLAHPARSREERALVSRAKDLLMLKSGMTEAEAHRFIQKRSMDTGSRAAETARLIIEAYD